MRIRLTFLTVLTMVLACGDEQVVGPEFESTNAVTPIRQWAGGRVLVSGVGIHEDGTIVFVDGEPVEATPLAVDTVAIVLPNPRLTGTAIVRVERNDRTIAVGSVEVVGAAWPVRILRCLSSCLTIPRLEDASPLYYYGVSAGAGRFLAFFGTTGLGGVVGIAQLDGPAPLLGPIARLAADELPGLVGPGPTLSANRWIVDTSSRNTATVPIVWEINPHQVEIEPLGCLSGGILGGYAIAELQTGDCLVLHFASPGTVGRLSINGTSSIIGYAEIPWVWTAGCASFRASLGNERIALRSLNGLSFCDPDFSPAPPAWPVFAADGSIAFSNTRYRHWPNGVSFSPDGNKLWTVGESTGWTLDEWDAETGELLREVQLPGVTLCVDALVDPIGPRIYISCFLEKFHHPHSPSLFVYDSESEIIEAVIDPLHLLIGLPALPPYELVHGGSSARVHLVAVWDGTTAPVERGVLVASYDTF